MPQVYRIDLVGASGHSVAADQRGRPMVAIWYMLAALTVGSRGAEREGQPRRPFVLYVLFISDGLGAPPAGRSRHGAGVEGRGTPATSMYLAVLASR
jgi:hypothetical protein